MSHIYFFNVNLLNFLLDYGLVLMAFILNLKYMAMNIRLVMEDLLD